MASVGWFPKAKFGQGITVHFEKPTFGAWSIDEKLSQHNFQERDWDPDPDYEARPPYAEATFRARHNNGTTAYMRVYMQVPHPSTEFEPREVRRRQARLCPHREVKALKCFHHKHATITPALFGFKEELQGDDDVVPGGFIVYMVFQRVPGIRLADDHGAYMRELSEPKFFREFDLAERDKIRREFNKNYPMLKELGWVPRQPWADHLVWDSASSKLWFIDFRKVLEADWLDKIPGARPKNDSHKKAPKPIVWKLWGLGIAPDDPKLLDDLTAWTL